MLQISTADPKRLLAARRALAHIRQRLDLKIAFELWDGSLVPEGAPQHSLRVAIASETALPVLLRSPRLKTLIRLYAENAIDIRGGSLFDLANQRPALSTREMRRRLDKTFLAKAILPFLFASGRPFPGSEFKQLDGGDSANKGRGSGRDDIAFHYDVSNRFYQLFLDSQMVYTCGYFREWANDLDIAQRDKLDMICRKLRLRPGEQLLDIGCGWGALVCHAAEHYGVTALGVTLSAEQIALARQRILERGLQDRVRVELQDYRTVAGPFDKIASIGMFEHVAIDNHEVYFRKINALLRPRGLYLHHAITRKGKASEKAFRRKRPEYDAMTRYIFPGAEVDHIGMSIRNLEGYGFEVHDAENWREHYARTTELWAHRLMANREAAVAEVGEARYRLWVLYLSGVSLAFSRGTLQIFQTLASKRSKGASGLPPTREDLYRD